MLLVPTPEEKREQLIDNINTLVEESSQPIKILVGSQFYCVQGVYPQIETVVLLSVDTEEETFEELTDELLHQIVSEALSVVNLFELLGR